MSGAAHNLPEDDPDLDIEDAETDDADEPDAQERALARHDDGVDEDLRITSTAFGAPAGAVGAVARSSAPRWTIPAWAMANPFTRFLAESILELTKVTWPEARVARNMTLIVIGMSVFVAAVLGAADFGLTQFVTWVISHAGPAVSPGATPAPPVLPTGP